MLDLDFPRENMLQSKLLLRDISRDKQHIPRKAEPITPTILIDMFPYLNLKTHIGLHNILMTWCREEIRYSWYILALLQVGTRKRVVSI